MNDYCGITCVTCDCYTLLLVSSSEEQYYCTTCGSFYESIFGNPLVPRYYNYFDELQKLVESPTPNLNRTLIETISKNVK